jgi:hypothetical protein
MLMGSVPAGFFNQETDARKKNPSRHSYHADFHPVPRAGTIAGAIISVIATRAPAAIIR